MTATRARRRPGSRARAGRTAPATRFERSSLALQEIVLIGATVLSGIVFWRSGLDPIQLPKATLLVAAAVVVLATGAARVVVTGALVVPRTAFVVAVTAFVVAVVAATVSGGIPTVSLPGEYSRLAGAVAYLAYAALGLTAARVLDHRGVTRLAAGLIVAAGVAAGYGMLQWAGLDPFTWGGDYRSAIFSTLGNPNFAAGYLAILTPLAVWGAMHDRWHPRWRVASGAVALAAVTVILAAGPLQGPLTAAAALGVLAIVWLATWDDPRRRWGIVAWGVAALAGLTAAALGAAGIGPLSQIALQRSFELRSYYWQAAASMLRAEPVTGVGMSLYGSQYRLHRSPEAAADLSMQFATDNAHSVPLTMFAEGGLILGVAYVAVVGVVAWTWLRGLRRDGEHRLVLGALGAAWLGYQVQSLVSIDVPALAVLNWVLAGAIVALATATAPRRFALPWSRTGAGRARGGKARRRERSRERLVLAAATALVLVALVPLGRALRGDAAHARATALHLAEQPDAAIAASAEATASAPWWSEMWLRRGEILAAAGRYEEAARVVDRAIAVDPLAWYPHRIQARIADARDRPEEARRSYERALVLEPLSPEFKAEVASFALKRDYPAWAVQLLEEAVDVQPDTPRWWVRLGEAREVADDVPGAIAAYRHALELDPDNRAAEQALRTLGDL